MKTGMIVLFCIITARLAGQATLTVSVFDDQSRKKVFPAILSIPGTTIPEYTLSETNNIINLSDYQIQPGTQLVNITITKKNYFDYRIPLHIVQSNNSENVLAIFMTSKTAVSKGDAYYVRGVVRDSSNNFLPNIVVKFADKEFTDTTDRYGYYSLKIPKNKVSNIGTFNILFTGGKRVQNGYATFKKPATYDYPLDMVLKRKNTADTIIGKLEWKKGPCRDVTVKLMQGAITYYNTKSNSEGLFTLIMDTAEIDPGKPAQLYFSGQGWENADTTFLIRNQKGIFTVTLHPSASFSRSPHEVFASAKAFPSYSDFTAALGYAYHLPALDRRLAVKAYGGFRGFRQEYEFNTLPDLSATSGGSGDFFTDTVTQTFQSLIIGAGVTGTLRPFDMNTRWNPVAEFTFTFGPKQGYWLIEPSISAGTLFNINRQMALSLQAQLSYSHFTHEMPQFETFADATFEKQSDNILRPFLVLTLQFFAAP
jgi:hypothetical protein